MKISITTEHVAQMRRNARRAVRVEGKTQAQALDDQAKSAGFANWSLLSRSVRHSVSAAPRIRNRFISESKISSANDPTLERSSRPTTSEKLRMECTDRELYLIAAIALRYKKDLASLGDEENIEVMSTIRDLLICHSNSFPLLLEELLAAPILHFIHDLSGINAHMNRITGKVEDFEPRYSVYSGGMCSTTDE